MTITKGVGVTVGVDVGGAMVGVGVSVGKGVSVANWTVGTRIGEIKPVGVGSGSKMVMGVGVPSASPVSISPVSTSTTVGSSVTSGVGVTVAVGVSGNGMTERGSTPGGMTITPGVEPLGGVTTTIPWIKSGVGVKVGAATRVGGGVGVGRTKRSPAAQPRVANTSKDKTIHGGGGTFG